MIPRKLAEGQTPRPPTRAWLKAFENVCSPKYLDPSLSSPWLRESLDSEVRCQNIKMKKVRSQKSSVFLAVQFPAIWTSPGVQEALHGRGRKLLRRLGLLGELGLFLQSDTISLTFPPISLINLLHTDRKGMERSLSQPANPEALPFRHCSIWGFQTFPPFPPRKTTNKWGSEASIATNHVWSHPRFESCCFNLNSLLPMPNTALSFCPALSSEGSGSVQLCKSSLQNKDTCCTMSMLYGFIAWIWCRWLGPSGLLWICKNIVALERLTDGPCRSAFFFVHDPAMEQFFSGETCFWNCNQLILLHDVVVMKIFLWEFTQCPYPQETLS